MSSKVVRRVLLGSVAAAVILAGLALVASAYVTRSAHAATQEIDPSYANDTVVYMIGPHLITNPSPSLLATAPPLYIAAYPWDGTNPPTFASGYKPQCDPCFHPGLPLPFVYHDHILAGAPGFGVDGTAQDNKGPWKIVVVMYDKSVETDPNFKPITNDEDLDAAVDNHTGEFQAMFPGPNPYEFVTGNVLICPLVSSHA